ncbi:class I SAM-dependent methyltransferase [candidate division CSSED10-310 bacterium]|uniref:Class I SAM-dependent methyltransferase n=1 Tax=candidate division CSSED10-310 bacterium TaxID=2855610 RepID=A0ABV6Z1E4_UNCC1
MKFTEAERQVLIATRVIYEDGKTPDQKNYERFNAYFFGDELVDWSIARQSLMKKELLVTSDTVYFLTKEGRLYADELIWNDSFSFTLIQCEQSKTYGVFCERVYGKNLTQFDMMDMAQLQSLLEVLKLDRHNHVLELGCGIGTIAEYISDVTKANIVGIDFAAGAIKRARERTQEKASRLTFQEGNMNYLDFPPDSFDTIIAIDTLYFVSDLEKTVARMMEILKPGGQMGIFYSSMAPTDDTKATLHPDKSLFAKAIQKYDVHYTALDFTEKEREIWQKQKATAEKLKMRFEEEGNLDIYHHRIKEAEIILKYVVSDRISRFLYHVRPPATDQS